MCDGSGQSQRSTLIQLSGRVPTLKEAKAQFQSSWDRVRAARDEKE
jgi:hypothetical protein